MATPLPPPDTVTCTSCGSVRLKRNTASGPLPRQPSKAFKHGLFTKSLAFASFGEARAYQRMRRELRRDLRPIGILEDTLVEQMSVSLWGMQRTLDIERRALKESKEGKLSSRALAQIEALERQFHRAHASLQKARGIRLAQNHAHREVEYIQWKKRRLEEAVQKKYGASWNEGVLK